MGCVPQPRQQERRGRYVVSSEVEQEFNWDELLVEQDDTFHQTQVVTITMTTLVDEDGDDAIQATLSSVGLGKSGLLLALELAYQMVNEEVPDEQEDDDDD